MEKVEQKEIKRGMPVQSEALDLFNELLSLCKTKEDIEKVLSLLGDD